MSEHERSPGVPAWPVRPARRPIETVMKVILVVVGGAIAAMLLYVAFFVAVFSLST
ncbi:hypothetical protein J7E96_16930 [Streptomyces sp. ISL-96]|uniref:hypothetical protein n=1 Tax=Streptomyces sp. ISL-96 TaxID=2819191 RepID=UPI001BE90CF8|nr:hypothetical protein [Streptomyces sp. ISL-96]MBT2490172.1 hypothetical protein [Streptomyces sp. ISL-96]